MAKKYFTQKQLKNIDIFEYKSVCYSILTNLVLDPLYSVLVYAIPSSVTPNQITVFNGILYTLFTTMFVTSCYSNEHPLLAKVFNQPLLLNQSVNDFFSNYGFYAHAIMLVVYQGLDSLDGKQARRTKTSSPSGHLLDHGIDALVTGLVCINLFYLIELSENHFYAYLACSLVVFFLNTWEEFHSKVLYFGLFSGAVEGLFAMSSLLILFPNKDFWHHKMIKNDLIISSVELVCKYVLQVFIQVCTSAQLVLNQLDGIVSLPITKYFVEMDSNLAKTSQLAINFFNKKADKELQVPIPGLYEFLVGKQGLFYFSQGMTLIQLLIIIAIVFTLFSTAACVFNVFKKRGVTGLFNTYQFVPFTLMNASVLYYLLTSDHVQSPKQFTLLVFGWVFSLAYANVSITCARILNQSFPVFPKVYLGYILLIVLKLIHEDVIK